MFNKIGSKLELLAFNLIYFTLKDISEGYVVLENRLDSNEASGLKKIGESCGEGHGELGWQKCGQCAEGLECEESTFVIPRCMTCKRKTGTG